MPLGEIGEGGSHMCILHMYHLSFTHNKYVPKNMHMVLIIDIFRLECTQIPVDQTLGWIPRTDIHREFAAVKESWQIALEIEIKYHQQSVKSFKQEPVK